MSDELPNLHVASNLPTIYDAIHYSSFVMTIIGSMRAANIKRLVRRCTHKSKRCMVLPMHLYLRRMDTRGCQRLMYRCAVGVCRSVHRWSNG